MLLIFISKYETEPKMAYLPLVAQKKMFIEMNKSEGKK